MTATDRAAEVIRRTAFVDWAYIEGTDDKTMFVENVSEVANALADAGLLLTDEAQAVLDAAERWFRDPVDAYLREAVYAYLATKAAR